ncbi:hypothetical protein HAX54_047587, partial [Datura stramonium]|nr:hypothetical protein [Datura stramonium]
EFVALLKLGEYHDEYLQELGIACVVNAKMDTALDLRSFDALRIITGDSLIIRELLFQFTCVLPRTDGLSVFRRLILWLADVPP